MSRDELSAVIGANVVAPIVAPIVASVVTAIVLTVVVPVVDVFAPTATLLVAGSHDATRDGHE